MFLPVGHVVIIILVVLFIFTLVYENQLFSLSQQFQQSRPVSSIHGQWGESIPVQLVATAAALLPSGNVLLWASSRADTFSSNENKPGRTISSVYDPATGIATRYNVTVTNHDMFCPGTSFDATGRLVVSGGSGEDRISVYDEAADGFWVSGPRMNIGRGYHSQVTLSDGRIFAIGGSWSGGVGGKVGEVYEMSTNTWKKLPDCPVLPLLTDDALGEYCGDNHAWLFAWSNGSVFQAGPSSAMNWYGTDGSGSHVSAHFRGRDSDAMNGNAVMYDAVNGKILTLGGSTSYSHSNATAAAHIITLGEPFVPPMVTEITSMSYPRAFANSVVLPNGEVLVIGGQTYPVQFTDDTAVLTPELWNPVTQIFTLMARMLTARTYHSTALLLPDATVLTGGGGLCWNACEDLDANHLDVQIFTPPYLFNGDGLLATRPKMLALSRFTLTLGCFVLVTTDMRVKEFALVRHGSVTHSINTDQRRVTLPKPHAVDEDSLTYNITIYNDPRVVVPGVWMLFAIGEDGVPSIAKSVFIDSI